MSGTDSPPEMDKAVASTTDTPLSREERFKSLRSKLAASSKANHAAVIAEHKRMKLDPASLSKLDRKKAEAEIKLAKQDAEEAGDDFERKRAWDWTMEEAEAWDRRLEKKKENRDHSAFAGTTQYVMQVC
jgi:pre-mRNA-splicing factor SYF2